MKKRRLFGILLSLALMLTVMPVLGLSQPAYALTTAWKVGEKIKLDGKYFCCDDKNLSEKYVGSNTERTVPDPVYDENHGQWKFADCVSRQGDVSVAPIWLTPPDDIKDITPSGFRIKSGTGTSDDPYKFELMYEFPLWVGSTQVTDTNMDNVLNDEGETVKYDPDTYTLTLNEAAITGRGNYGDPQNPYSANIHSEGIDLNIVLEGNNKVDSGTGTKATEESADYAIDVNASNSQGGSLTIAGTGELAVNGHKTAISTDRDCEISNGNITATSDDDEALFFGKDFVMDGGEVTAESEDEEGINAVKVDVNDGIVNATGSKGIYAQSDNEDSGNITITNGNVTAIGKDAGIEADNSLTVSGGTVTASATGNGDADAIYAGGNVNISGASTNVIATTDGRYAICGKNITIENKAHVVATGNGSDTAIVAKNGDITINSSEVEATAYGGIAVCSVAANGKIKIDGSEVRAKASGYNSALNSINVEVNNSKVSAEGYNAISADRIDITNSVVDNAEGSGSLHAYKMLTIRDSLVTVEGITKALNVWKEGIKIEYTGSGKYSTRVEATATGELGPQGLSANRIDSDKIAVWAKKDGLNIGDKLAITKPEGGRKGNVEKAEEEPFTTILDSKGNPADHVVIEVAKPTPAPTPAPVANPLTVKTTAKTTTRATTIKWTWNTVNGASKYKVAYHKVGSKKWKVKTTKKTKYVLKGQKIKGLYEYKVAAVTASGDVWSDTSCRYFKTVKTKAKFSKGALKVSWKKDKGAAGYEVFIARNKKMDGAQVIQVAPDSKSYKVTGLAKGRYYVKVKPMKNYNGVTYTGILCKARKVKVK